MSSLTFFAGSVPENYDKYLGPDLFEPYALDVASRLRTDRCRNILELASGTGRVTRHLINRLTEDGKIVATDLNGDMLEIAKAKVKDERIEWQVIDAHVLPFEDQSFDHVVCQFGVMFFEDKQKAFAETRRVLEPGGKFIFNTWGSIKDNPRSAAIKDVMENVFKNEAPDFLQKGPYSFYDVDEIEQLMKSAGFSNITVEEVKKTVIDWNIDDYLKGFLEGSPLSAFLSKHEETIKESVKGKLKEAFLKKFGVNVETSMLAYVCEGYR